MSERFTVDPGALRGLSSTMDSLCDKLDEARTRTRNVDASDLGSSGLAGAVSRFTEHWAFQADRIGQTLQQSAVRLRQAADQYQDVEDAQQRAQTGSG